MRPTQESAEEDSLPRATIGFGFDAAEDSFEPPAHTLAPVIVSVPPTWRRAPTEAGLQGHPITHYTLGPQGLRYSVPPADVNRVLVHAARVATDRDTVQGSTYPLFSNFCLVTSVKSTFNGASPDYRFRFVLDLDCNVAEGGAWQLPEPGLLHGLVSDWATATFAHDFSVEPCGIFLGRFDDKPVSAHVYYPECTLEPDMENVYKEHHEAFDRLDEVLRPYGLTGDTSITTSGVKLPFMDKWLGKHRVWRGDTMVPYFAFGYDLTSMTWDQFFNTFNPIIHVQSLDDAPTVLKFPPPKRRVANHGPASRLTLPVPQLAPVEGSSTEARVRGLFQGWSDVVFKRMQKPNGVQFWVPQTNRCPLKTRPSNDEPAHVHRGFAKAFVVVDAGGNALIRCQICPTEMRVAGPPLDEDGDIAREFEYYNARFALLGRDQVLVLPQILSTGEYYAHQVMTQHQFLQQEKRTTRGIKIGKKTVQSSQLWLESEVAPRYPLGLTCDPSESCDPRFFNTWKGFNPCILSAAESLDADAEFLQLRLPAYTRLVTQNICAGDDECFDYFLNWCAHVVQKPWQKPGTAPVLVGPPGCGKGLTVSILARIVGQDYAVQVDSQTLRSHYNAVYSERVLVHADEAIRSDKEEDHNAMKMLITEDSSVVHEKYQPARQQKTFQHVIITSNSKAAVYAQAGERRFFMLPCAFRLGDRNSPEEIELREAVVREIEDDECVAAWYLYLKNRDIQDWRPQAIPITRASWQVQYESLNVYWRYIYRVLCTQDITTTNLTADDDTDFLFGNLLERGEWYMVVNKPDVSQLGFSVFRHVNVPFPSSLMWTGFTQMMGIPRSSTSAQLWSAWYELVPKAQWHFTRMNFQGTPKRLNTFRFPPLDDLRRRFVEIRGNVDARIFTDENWRIE